MIKSGIEENQGTQEHPTQSIIGVTGLSVFRLLIEIEVTVVLP